MPEARASQWRTYAIPVTLLLLSIATTTAIGARFMQNFNDRLPLIAQESDLWPWPWLFEHPARFLLGWPFSLALLSILLAHEFGHYAACRWHGVRCSLPWVLPAPTLSGTLGAVIRLRGRIPDRRILMDIGVWGPIAGYVASLVAAVFGIELSAPASAHQTHPSAPLVAFNPPLTLTLLRASVAHLTPSLATNLGASAELAVCHPVLLAAWIGLFITSLNLIPCGQLDGGHILYSLSPPAHRIVSLVLPFLLFVAAWYCWIGWAVWGFILLIPVMRHPRVPAELPLDRPRVALAIASFFIFFLSVAAAPFTQSSLSALLH